MISSCLAVFLWRYRLWCLILCFALVISHNHLSSAASFSSLSSQRILSEVRDSIKQNLSLDIPFNDSSDECGVRLSPLKRNILEWHFTFMGMQDSCYAGGLYHGKILLDPDYPRKAPTIALLTPSGRWEVNKSICLSASSYHPESWDPNILLRSLVLSLRNFMTSQAREIGSINSSPVKRLLLAEKSRSWNCKACGVDHSILIQKLGSQSSGESNTVKNKMCRGELISKFVDQSVQFLSINGNSDDFKRLAKVLRIRGRQKSIKHVGQKKTIKKRRNDHLSKLFSKAIYVSCGLYLLFAFLPLLHTSEK